MREWKIKFTVTIFGDILLLKAVMRVFYTVISRFEQYISEYSYARYKISEEELVYKIEDSIIVHISVRTENYGRIVLEVIFDEGIYDLNLKKFEKESKGYCVQVFPYYGNLGLSNPYMRSCYERVNAFLPELEIEKRFEQWQGFPVQHLLFELTEDGETGYAACASKAKQTIKKVISTGEDLLFACLNAESLRQFNDKDVQYFHASGMKASFILDRVMVNIILNRLKGKSRTWKSRKISPGQIGIEEAGLKFCWINARIKSPSDRFDGKVIRDVKNGYYDDVDRYEFVLPDNKWKSEQLVYELVKQLYPKGNVWYQYRPDFLISDRGQLSYDIYIAKLRIAIEYQGKQHFEPVEFFGGAVQFEKQKQRDALKAQLSKAHNIKLIYINYWEDISAELIKRKIDEILNNP